MDGGGPDQGAGTEEDTWIHPREAYHKTERSLAVIWVPLDSPKSIGFSWSTVSLSSEDPQVGARRPAILDGW